MNHRQLIKNINAGNTPEATPLTKGSSQMA
jgi:hypothetical protein